MLYSGYLPHPSSPFLYGYFLFLPNKLLVLDYLSRDLLLGGAPVKISCHFSCKISSLSLFLSRLHAHRGAQHGAWIHNPEIKTWVEIKSVRRLTAWVTRVPLKFPISWHGFLDPHGVILCFTLYSLFPCTSSWAWWDWGQVQFFGLILCKWCFLFPIVSYKEALISGHSTFGNVKIVQ